MTDSFIGNKLVGVYRNLCGSCLHVSHLTAVEKDHRLAIWLAENLGQRESFKLIEGDVLKVGIPQLLCDGFDKVVSNLPYTPGSRILLDLVRDINAPRLIVVTLQLEVAQRITATPGSKSFGLMGVWCQLHYKTELIKTISPNCFWPRPDVKSAIVKLSHREEMPLTTKEENHFYKLTRYAFQQRRKQLVSILAKAPQDLRLNPDDCRNLLQEMELPVSARPEAINLQQWCILTRATSM